MKQKPYSISASLGLFSRKPDPDITLVQIFEAVDRDMYRNKSARKELDYSDWII